jgi:hypothetical protein
MIINALREIDPNLITVCMPDGIGTSEAWAQQKIRLDASFKGGRMWTNNMGAAHDLKANRMIRYGLANDSARINKVLKSSDLIGVMPTLITPDMVGHYAGLFTSIEVKKPGWHYRGGDHEAAQLAWMQLILSLGGIAGFSTGGTHEL